MKALIIGASAGLGRALSQELSARGWDLYLVASTGSALQALSQELSARFGGRIFPEALDLRHGDIAGLKDRVLASLGSPDALFLVAGFCNDQDAGQVPDELLCDLAQVNFLAPMRIANAFVQDLAGKNPGYLVGIGTIAQSRARRANAVYASAKSGLEFYFEALRHHLAFTKCRVHFFRMGYMATRMTMGQKLLLPAMAPEKAAKAILACLDGRQGVRYLPKWWALVMAVFRLLPWGLYKRMKM